MHIAISLSCFIPFCVFLLDGLALNTRKYDVHEEFKNWSITNGTGIPPDELYSSVKEIMVVDGVILLVSIVAVTIAGIYYCCSCCCCRSAPPTYCNTMLPCCFLALFPAANVATHFNQISLGFIHSHEHAVCVGLFCIASMLAYISLIITISPHGYSHQCECLCTVSISLLLLLALLLCAILMFFNRPD